MAISHDEIYTKVQGVLVDALGVDEEEIKPDAVIKDDLGAESIDFLDISFRLEKAFGIKIGKGEMMPDLSNNAELAQNGKVT
ncbi:MAG: phosphopantetheine-binding protein, partial [Phycisphaerales bacterium]|nr:phosphopantetheine-binding protein [Phycisphaerales bacterium]